MGRPTISVGNITVGGTGKTPLVIRLASDLAAQGLKPAVLSRGYRGFLKQASSSSIIVGDASETLSDEVALMAEKLEGVPIGVGANRVQTAGIITERFSPDVFILDDGFQHWPVHRDLDIVCVDSIDPWGGALLPLGRRREPLSQLKRAHAVVLTRTDLAPVQELDEIEAEIRKRSPPALLLRSEFSPSLRSVGQNKPLPPAQLSGKSVWALSALGRPAGFERTLGRLGGLVMPIRYPDHHRYTEKDLDDIEAVAGKSEGFLITTEKDWMKLRHTRWGRTGGAPGSLHILHIAMKFQGDDERTWSTLLEEHMDVWAMSRP